MACQNRTECTHARTHLCRDERLRLEQVEVVAVSEVGQQLSRQAVQRGHDGQWQLPVAVAGAVHELGELERLVVVEPECVARGLCVCVCVRVCVVCVRMRERFGCVRMGGGGGCTASAA